MNPMRRHPTTKPYAYTGSILSNSRLDPQIMLETEWQLGRRITVYSGVAFGLSLVLSILTPGGLVYYLNLCRLRCQ